MANYSTIFGTLAPELRNMRKAEAVFEDFHFTDASTYAKRLASAAYSLTDIFQETALNVASGTYERQVAPSLQSISQTLKSAFEFGWFPVLDNEIKTNPSDKSVGAIGYIYDPTLSDGTISIFARTGRWGALRKKMIADGVVIVKNSVTFGSLAPSGDNEGTMTLSRISGEDHTLSGTITLVCTDDTVGATAFAVINNLVRKLADQGAQASADGLTSFIPADNSAIVGKSFEDGPTGISMLLAYSALEVIDAQGVINQGLGFAPTVTNPSEEDTNKGRVYLKIRRQSIDPVWQATWYKDAAQTEVVGTGSAPHDTPSFFIAGTGGTSIVFNLDTAAADIAMPGAGNFVSGIVLDLNLPRIDDQFVITVTNSENGLFATKIARRYRASLNSAPAKPTIPAGAGLSGGGAGNVDNGTHTWYYSYVVGGVESVISGASGVVTVVDKTADGKVSLSGVAVGPSGTTARHIYRTVAGNTGTPKLVATLADNVTTTYIDNTADASLGAAATVLTQIDDSLAASVSLV